jgi:hypothetical protein
MAMTKAKVGRPKKLGDQVCFSIECPGFMKLGRYRTKKVRGRRNARYIEHEYFRHNDNIREHYVNKATRQLWHEYDILDELNVFIETISHGFHRIYEDVKTFPLKEDEKRRWLMANIKLRDDLINPLKLIELVSNFRKLSAMTGEPLPEWVQSINDEIETLDIGKSLQTIRATHPYFDELDYLHVQYQNNRILERRERQKKSWHKSQNEEPPRTLAV